MVVTEAAGEGIDLQFCHLMVNYDIPRNPNRLEQRNWPTQLRTDTCVGGHCLAYEDAALLALPPRLRSHCVEWN
jgi:hypothetical protein